jgi:outer membrane protein assembly factor BamB
MRGRWSAIGAAMVGTLALAGCWPAPGQGPDRRSENALETRITVDSVASLTEDWTVDTGDVAAGAPVVSPSGVHARSGMILRTLDRSDGAELWQFDGTFGAPTDTMSDPIWQDGTVFVGYGFGNIGGNWEARVLDAGTGAQVRDLGGGLVDGVRGPTAALSTESFGSGGPVAVTLEVQGDIDDPATHWEGVLDVGSLGGVSRTPATVGADGIFHAGRGPLSTTPSTNPQLGNGVRRFTVEQPASCSPSPSPLLPCPEWATALAGTSSVPPVIAPGQDTVYTGTNLGTVYALDAATGAVRWSAPVGAAVTGSPALAQGTLFVPTADGDVVALAAGGCGAPTCSPLWSAPTGSPVTVQPAVAGGVVFTGSADGSLHGFTAAGCGAATCEPLWSVATGSRITGAPAVAFGQLFVGTQDGRLIAYAPDPDG